MQIICDFFYILLFMTTVGGVFTIVSLAANRIMRFVLPLWFVVCGMMAYIVPVPAPGLRLVSPEEHSWIPGYYLACGVWFCGVILFTIYDLARMLLAHRAIRNYQVCEEERIIAICAHCAALVHMKNGPSVYFGALEDPACVVGVLRPAIILNKEIIARLTDEELLIVLCHEATHIKRGHIIWSRIYDYICILNWLNPLVWIAKKEFAVHCEIDCDRRALACLENRTTNVAYAGAMLRLLGLSAAGNGSGVRGMSALGFLVAKRRMETILCKSGKAKKIFVPLVFALLFFLIILFSMAISRGHFYPYPAYQSLSGVEYSCIAGSFFWSIKLQE